MDKNVYSVASSVNAHYSKDEIIRYLYRYLSQCFMSYPKYFLAPEEEKIKIFKEGFNIKLPYVVCITLCKEFKKVFDEFGIESQIIESTNSDNKVPLYSLIVKGDSKYYYLNPLYDLFNNQLGIKTNAFGYICENASSRIFTQYPHLENLSLEYIQELDDSLGIKHINSVFEKDSYNLKNRFKYDYEVPFRPTLSQIIESKIQIILNKYNNYGHVNGPIERERMYNYFINQVFNKKEKRNVETNNSCEEFDYLPEITDKTTGETYRESKENGIYVMRKVIR